MPEVTIEMKKERETKGTVRYEEEGDLYAVGTLYVRKHVVAQLGNPDRLTLTIAPPNGK